MSRCPVKLLTPLTNAVTELYMACRSFGQEGIRPNGAQPNAGGVLDQPHTLMTAFIILDNTVNQLWREKMASRENDG